MSESVAHGIFHNLVGHEGAKTILRSALRGGEVDILLTGPPASGKSVALLSLDEAVDIAIYRDASGFTGAKLRETLSTDPPILLLDEIDDMRNDAYPALYTAMEHGRVQKSTMHDEYDLSISTQVVAACNAEQDLPREIRSRFQTVRFEEYDRDEFIDVAARVLIGHDVWVTDGEDAVAIAESVYDGIADADVRTARDVAKLAGAVERVPDIIEAINDPTADVTSEPLTPDELSSVHQSGPSVSLTFNEWLRRSCPHLNRHHTVAYRQGRLRCSKCSGGDPFDAYSD